mgnify:CR=1 FL=1
MLDNPNAQLDQFKKDLARLKFDHKAWCKAMPTGYNRAQIANALDVTGSNLLSIEKGRSNPGLLLAARYARLVGVSLDTFFK